MLRIKFPDIEYKLAIYVLYIFSLLFLLFQPRGWQAMLYVHLFFTFLLSLVYFGKQFLFIFVSPIITLVIFFENLIIRKYLKKFQLNTPSDVAIILGHSNWFMFEAWVKPNYTLGDIKILVKYLQKSKKNFSFYPSASLKDVEQIMGNSKIKEVYFLGHGTSHVFQLKNDDILYYCDFNDLKYQKNFVHQIHCGTEDGKSLVDYVVPEENKSKCYFVRKSINSFDIAREFKKRLSDS